MRRFAAILLMMIVTGGILLPDVIVVKMRLHAHRHAALCEQLEGENQYDKLKNNGDKYLLSLLKRTCNSSDEQQSKLPVLHIPVFVKIFTGDPALENEPVLSVCRKNGFYYANHYTFLHVTDIFHPPAA